MPRRHSFNWCWARRKFNNSDKEILELLVLAAVQNVGLLETWIRVRISQKPIWALAVFRKYSGTVFLRKSWNCCWHRCENINYDKDVLALLLLRALQHVVLLRTCINFHGVGFENTNFVQDVCQEFAAASIFCCWPTPPVKSCFYWFFNVFSYILWEISYWKTWVL